MSLRMEVTERNTPGSIGGGVALPALGVGSGGGGGKVAMMLWGDEGGEWSPRLWNPLSRWRTAGFEGEGDSEVPGA